MTIPKPILKHLDSRYLLSDSQKDFFESNRFIKLKNVFNEEIISFFNTAITNVVSTIKSEDRPLEQRDTYGKAFLQLFNLWTKDAVVKELVLSKRLGMIASELMKVKGVRLYHDQALFKEPGGGITPWHADQYYWPLETDKTITAWIPLQETRLDMGPLEFSSASHQLVDGRELKISDESEVILQNRLRITDFKHVVEPFDLGEISFHSGWVFHRAGVNTTKEMRKVMTVIYMDKEMRLKQPENENQIEDWKTWCPGAKVGEEIDTELNPVIWSR